MAVNNQKYAELREEMYNNAVTTLVLELDQPRSDYLVKVYGAVFDTALKHIEALVAAGAKGQDIQTYITKTAGTIQNAGLMAERIQATSIALSVSDNLKSSEFSDQSLLSSN